MTRAKTRLILFAFLALAVCGAGWLAWLVSVPYRASSQPVFVEIPRGSTTRDIASKLETAGVVRSAPLFLAARYVLPGRSLKAGEYFFDRALSVRQVLNKLRRGDVYYHTLTIPEGYNIYDVASAMAGTDLVTYAQAQAALENTALVADLDPTAKTLEGYVFPDTYRFTRPANAREMVAAMVLRFRSVYGDLARKYSPPRPARDVVTMASLVEKETGLPAERSLVASVFYNRLAAGMRLQCDPTVIYAAINDGRYRGTIYESDLQSNSPYNTYTHAGMPPGPIANPGRASLEAAMAPAPSKYLYFVAKGESGHRFAATLAEHARNVASYRRSQH